MTGLLVGMAGAAGALLRYQIGHSAGPWSFPIVASVLGGIAAAALGFLATR